MCRDIASGGRRCPSHTNPALVATRNAKRRALYAKKVKTNSSDYQTETLGVNTKDNTEQSLFVQKQTITGIIDYNTLNTESYKDFGFQEIGEPRNTFTLEQAQDNSSEEIESLTSEEKAALRYYTSNNYQWINQTLYGIGPSLSDEDTTEPYFTGDKLDLVHYKHPTRNGKRNIPIFNEVTSTLDNALAKNSSGQKIVYRGIHHKTEVLREFDDTDDYYQAYIDNRLNIGQEVVFDGYQSTSIEAEQAVQYTNKVGGMVLEILTSSATNVTKVSEFPEEYEAIISRNSRYMVVGVHKSVPYFTGRGNVYKEMNIVQLVEIDDTGAVTDDNYKRTVPKAQI